MAEKRQDNRSRAGNLHDVSTGEPERGASLNSSTCSDARIPVGGTRTVDSCVYCRNNAIVFVVATGVIGPCHF